MAATYPGIVDPKALADSFAGFLDALDLDAAVIAGSSFAAYWLQFFALHHPKRIRKILLGNGFVECGELRSHPLFNPTLIFENPPAILQQTWHARVSSGPDTELRRLQLDMLSGRQSVEVLQTRLASVVMAEPCPKLPIADNQIILLDCVDDPIITAPMQAQLRARYDNAVVHTLSFGGHYPHLLNPDAYNAALRASVGNA